MFIISVFKFFSCLTFVRKIAPSLKTCYFRSKICGTLGEEWNKSGWFRICFVPGNFLFVGFSIPSLANYLAPSVVLVNRTRLPSCDKCISLFVSTLSLNYKSRNSVFYLTQSWLVIKVFKALATFPW